MSMMPWSYTSRLTRDLDRWQQAGLIDDPGRSRIDADLVAARSSRANLPAMLAILGATLLGFAAMTFVAANWQGMSRLARLLMLATGMWGAYAAAAVLFTRSLPAFGHAAVLTGTADVRCVDHARRADVPHGG